jgi:hypothetical protein
MVYALELLAGVHPGEAASLRWRHYDPTVTPLGKILVAKSVARLGRRSLPPISSFVPVAGLMEATPCVRVSDTIANHWTLSDTGE